MLHPGYAGYYFVLDQNDHPWSSQSLLVRRLTLTDHEYLPKNSARMLRQGDVSRPRTFLGSWKTKYLL